MKISLLVITVSLLIPIIVVSADTRLSACEYNICRMNNLPTSGCLASDNGYNSTEDVCFDGSHYRCFCAVYTGSKVYCSGPQDCTNNGFPGSCKLTDKSCCSDECTVVGDTCSGNNKISCGNFDGDPCLEKNTVSCPYGCANGVCKPAPPPTECGDGIDNDGDGLIDYGIDPGCISSTDTTERNNEPIPRCGDGIIGIPLWGLNNNCYGIIEQCDDNNTDSGDGCSSTCQVESSCGNGIINAGEQCDGANLNNKHCSDFGFSSGNLSCNNCQFNTNQCLYTVQNVAYGPTYTPSTQGCNPDLRVCGRDGRVNVSIRVHNSDNTAGGTYIDTTLKSDNNTGGDCVIYDIDYTASAPDINGYINYTYNVNPNVLTGACYNKTVNHTTAVLKEGGPNGASRSNVYDGYSLGFRLNECGDGEIDTIPSSNIYEQCDYNLTSHSWMNTSCTNLGYTGGIATCNQLTCQWNKASCYSCGDGIKNGTEECDDGNLNNYDQCNNTCQITYCGNGLTNTPSGKNYSTSYVPTNTPPPYFGMFEQCDDGDTNNINECRNNCTKSFCGDGVRNIQFNGYDQREYCDNGTLNSFYGLCNPTCGLTFCGDGYLQQPNGARKNGTDNLGFETCDDGSTNSPTGECNTNCTLTFCGDRVIQPYAPRYEQCEPFNDSNCNSNCRYSTCGDSLIGIGEECDDGGICNVNPQACTNSNYCVANGYGTNCIPQNGDGCSAFCLLTNCTVTGVSTTCPPGQICGKSDKINVTVQYSGNSCNKANTIQVDYSNAYGNCNIQFKTDNINNDMQGMNHTFTSGFSPFRYTYSVPSIPNGCAGQNLANVTAAFYQSNGYGLDILRSNNYYIGNTPNITLDQCKQYGVVSNYTNSGVNSGIKVINNSVTGCYYYTCKNYVATQISFFNFTSGAGVRLGNKLYYCDINHEDFVCPDDFEYNGKCAQGSIPGGVCTTNGRADADCKAKTPMKCGITVNAYGTLIPTCNITKTPPTPPTLYCVNSSMCVYANETSGLNKTCMSFNSTRKNAENHNIQCVSNNTWCPQGYLFNGTNCYNPIPQCISSCVQAYTVAKYVGYPDLLKKWSVWKNYLNNSGCFLTNSTTDRRRAYCGVSYAWPEVLYQYLPVGVSYTHWDVFSQKYVQDGNVVPIIIPETQE